MAPKMLRAALRLAALAAVATATAAPNQPATVLHVVAPLGGHSSDAGAAGDDGAAGVAGAASADGSAALPFHSVAAARDALRTLQPLAPGGAEVVLHSGTHAPFELRGADDSGRPDAPIVYRAALGEAASVSGGLRIPGSAFAPWDGPHEGVLRADLSALGVTRDVLGSMRTDSMRCVGDCQHDKSELFLGGAAMTLARFPNKNAAGGWEYLKADLAGEFGRISANTGGPWFLMRAGANATRIASWAEDDRASGWLHGYWSKDWADCYRKLLRTTPVTVNGTAYVNVSFEAQTHNDDNADTHARL